MEADKNIRFGLRFKFSLLIGVLVLLLTLGISAVLSYYTINHEKRALAEQMKRQADLSLENMTNVAREGILNNDELLLLSYDHHVVQIHHVFQVPREVYGGVADEFLLGKGFLGHWDGEIVDYQVPLQPEVHRGSGRTHISEKKQT
jgi:CHASE1-domain containing sensor protein